MGVAERSVGRYTILAIITIMTLVGTASTAKSIGNTKRLFSPSHDVTWDVEWGECGRQCGLHRGEVKARAVCVSELNNHELGKAACHGVQKPVLPEKRQCNVRECERFVSKRVFENSVENSTAKEAFSPKHCDRVIQAETGEVTSPNWPRKSIQFLQCQLTILLPRDKRPRLTFGSFTLEGGMECTENNYVEIFDTGTNRSEALCGDQPTFTWTADSNEVKIRFSAESEEVFNRFHATYVTIPKAPQTDCSSVFTGRMGRYFSSEFPSSNNAQSSECEVLFHTSPSNRVSLSFLFFTVPCEEYVTLKNTLTDDSKSFCGAYEHFSWTSSGNEAVLIYEKSRSDEEFVIDFEYEPLEVETHGFTEIINCTRTITGVTRGTITSPGYPEAYPDDADCHTLIVGEPGQVVTISFLDFMLEPSNDVNGEPMESCQFDHVMIVDITTDKTNLYCGLHQPFSWTSDSNQVLILLNTDDSESYTGYHAEFLIYDEPVPDCVDITVTNDTSTQVSSLLHPNSYPSSKECSMNIHQKPDLFFIFDLLTFDLEESDNCEKDALQLMDLTTKRTDRFCGQLSSFSWTSDSNEVQLSFSSDEMIQRTGFQISSRTMELPQKNSPERDCRQRLTKSRDFIRLPVSPGIPPLGRADCFLLISVQPTDRIILKVDTFAIEPPPTGQEADSVQIQDISLQQAHEERLEGELPSFTWTSSRNELLILATQHSSDIASVRLHGTYHTTPRPLQACSRTILEDEGVVQWPDDFSSDSTDCELTFHTHPLKRVILTFDKLQAPGIDCSDFKIEIFDVEPSRTLSYCETQFEPFSIISTSNEIRLQFKWTNSRPLSILRRQVLDNVVVMVRHFVMERPLQAVEHVAEYHRVYRQLEGEFSSLDHGRAVWMLGNCSVLIEVPSDMQVLIHLQDFLIGGQHKVFDDKTSKKCNPEFVLIEDVSNGRENIYCGNFKSFSWLSDTNAVLVTFFTNPVVVYHGFRAKYEAVQRVDGPTDHFSEDTGRFTSTNFPDQYPSNLEHSWVIHSTPDHIVSLVFDSFQLEDSDDCSKDFVKIEDMSSGFSSVLCGTHGLFAWTSSGNEVIVTIETDDDIPASGISVEHTWVDVSEGCFLLLRGESGTIKSSEFLEEHEHWEGSCQLVIHTSPDKRLSILVEGMVIENDCGNAGLTVVDIATLRRKVICEVNNNFVFTTDSNEVAIGYINYQTTPPDFTISWHSLHRDVVPAECTNIFHVPALAISLTDGLPTLPVLPADSGCQILFTLPPVQTVLLVIHELSIPDADCEKHYFEIEDLATLRYDRYCEVNRTFSWKADSNEVIVKFSKTSSTIRIVLDFNSIRYPKTSDCSKVLTAVEGDIQSVGFPSDYPLDMECQTLIHAQPDARVQIVFSEFELEEPTEAGSCSTDYLKLSDLTTGENLTLCGQLGPFIWSSIGSEVLLEFVSDESNTFPGYAAYYTVLPWIPDAPGCNVTLTSETGIIQSPNNASSIVLYDNALNCYQWIVVEPSQYVILSFSVLKLESDPQCSKDFIEIRDVITQDVSVFCGNKNPFTWISEGNEVIVKFQTDDENRFQGYRATFRALEKEIFSSCDSTLTSPDGSISSPGFPSRYDNDVHCITKIIVEDHALIKFVFWTFEVEEWPDCSYDYLELRTQGLGAPQTFCGSKSPFSWLSAGNIAIVTFHSDHIITSGGFKADYETISKLDQLKACDESLFARNGSLSSPHFPKPYPGNKDCRITITAEPDYVVQIYFTEFEVEFHEECKYDYVLIKNLPDGVQDKYCGTLNPFTWVSEGNEVVVEFHSDASTMMKGFSAHYVTFPAPILPEDTINQPAKVSKCNSEMSAQEGVLTSPNFPYKYDNDQMCRTEIETEVGTRINVTFHFMDIEEHRGCQWDHVEILDVNSGRKSEPFCGSLFGQVKSWQSDSNHIVVIFVSDDIVTRIGFYATYTVK
ncbi:cubilin-like [Asterias rubens]|uniref:cubilin-like n=1 Tax=Asterias rubens TaxID=7604 RepID=UPI0014557BFD|nr:cubilin-like [Asterias rubens]